MYYTLDKNNKVIEAFECSGAPLDGYGITDKPVKYGDIYNATTDSFTADPVDIAKDRIADIDAQITAIEATQPRQIREITLGLDTQGTAQAMLSASNNQITALRTERQGLATQLN